MQAPVTKLLITGAGGAGTIEVLKALRATGRYELVVADASPHAYGYQLADRSYVIPFGADPRFHDTFYSLIEREHPDFVIPLVDEELPQVHQMAQAAQSGQHPFRVIAPRPEFCALALDKWAMAQAMERLGLPTARSALASELPSDFPFPAIVKPRTGRGSRGFARLGCRQDLQRYLEQAADNADRYLVQEQCTGREFTTSVVVSLSNVLLAVVPKEAVEKRGITVVGVTRDAPAIDSMCRELHQRMEPAGPFNVQLMLGEDGKPRVFEINPRYSTTVALTLAAGVDEVDLVLQHALGNPVTAPAFKPDCMMLRYSTQIITSEAEWAKLASDLR